MTTTYTLDVIGRGYAGYKAAYTYKAPHEVLTSAEIKRLAGDFDSIEDYRITKSDTRYENPDDLTSITIRTDKIVLNWQREESQDIFSDCLPD